MISFPFDSQMTGTDAAGLPLYDRASSSDDLARLFASFFTNGIFAPVGFEPTVSGMVLRIGPGDCLINGRYGYEAGIRSFILETAGSLPRIDTAVLRLNLETAVRSIDIYVKTGTPASVPQVPALTREGSIWELGICNIRVNANVSSVNQSNVTDTRLNTNRCGTVVQTMKSFDTQGLYAQVQADMAEFKAEEQAAFDAWFQLAKNTLGEDSAGNLLNLVNQKLPLAGGEMTGVIRFRGPVDAENLIAYGGSVGISATSGNVYFTHTSNGEMDNYLTLAGEEVRLGRALGVKYGGTGSDTVKGARNKLGVPGISTLEDVTIPAGWSTGTYTVGLGMVEEGNKVFLMPKSDDYDHFMDCRMRVKSVEAGKIILTATTIPTRAIHMDIVVLSHAMYLSGGDVAVVEEL